MRARFFQYILSESISFYFFFHSFFVHSWSHHELQNIFSKNLPDLNFFFSNLNYTYVICYICYTYVILYIYTYIYLNKKINENFSFKLNYFII